MVLFVKLVRVSSKLISDLDSLLIPSGLVFDFEKVRLVLMHEDLLGLALMAAICTRVEF